jgi:hypothetical protein
MRLDAKTQPPECVNQLRRVDRDLAGVLGLGLGALSRGGR